MCTGRTGRRDLKVQREILYHQVPYVSMYVCTEYVRLYLSEIRVEGGYEHGDPNLERNMYGVS